MMEMVTHALNVPVYNLDEDFQDFVQLLVDGGELEEGTPAYGIAKKVAADGVDGLTPRQFNVLTKYVINPHVTDCKRCGEAIPWCEMYWAVTEDGYCSWCSHMEAKDDCH